MSSQSNQSKNSIKRISDYILSEQNIDIKNYTVGHLNEDHLYKKPGEKTARRWKLGSQEEYLKSLSKKPKQVRRHPSKPYSSLSDINEILENFKNFESFASESSSSLGYVKNASLPSGLIKLPQLEGSKKAPTDTDVKWNLPMTEKEMAVCFLNGPFKGASKSERFKNLGKFEKEVIQKENLLTNNSLHSIESVNFLEKRLQNVRIGISGFVLVFVDLRKFLFLKGT